MTDFYRASEGTTVASLFPRLWIYGLMRTSLYWIFRDPGNQRIIRLSNHLTAAFVTSV